MIGAALLAFAPAAQAVVQSEPLACAGRSSHVADGPRDVVWASGTDPVPDQSRPTIDMTDASLRSQAGKLCWQVRFARSPGPVFELDIRVSRRSRKPAPWNTQPVEFTNEVLIQVRDGAALAGIPSADDGPMAALSVELSRTGTLVRVKLAARDVLDRRKGLDPRRAFRWNLTVVEHNPTGFEDTSDWMDELPRIPVQPGIPARSG